MSKKNKLKKLEAKKAEDLPAAAPVEKAPTKKFLKYQKEWEIEGNRNSLTRTINRANLKKLLNEPEMTWAEYCDHKAAAWAEYWEARKINPTALKRLKKLTPVQHAKKLALIEKRKAALAQLEAEAAMGIDEDAETEESDGEESTETEGEEETE